MTPVIGKVLGVSRTQRNGLLRKVVEYSTDGLREHLEMAFLGPRVMHDDLSHLGRKEVVSVLRAVLPLRWECGDKMTLLGDKMTLLGLLHPRGVFSPKAARLQIIHSANPRLITHIGFSFCLRARYLNP